jgi:ribosomal protein S27AE
LSEVGGSVENMTTMTNETEVPACGRCGSTALHHVEQ